MKRFNKSAPDKWDLFDHFENNSVLRDLAHVWETSDSRDSDDLVDILYDAIRAQIPEPLARRYSLSETSGDSELDYDIWSLSDHIREDVILGLDVSGKNFSRLLRHIHGWDSYNAYSALFDRFLPYVDTDELDELTSKVKSIFVEEVSEDIISSSRNYRFLIENEHPSISILLRDLVHRDKKISSGTIVRANNDVWDYLIRKFSRDWASTREISPDKWEELIAAALDASGYNKVILTPRSKDFGRDIIAEKHGMGSVKLAVSVKAYQPGRLVRYDDVRSLVGVLGMDPSLSKGIITTLTDFPPAILEDELIAPLIPFRLELINGRELRQWLRSLAEG